MGPPKQQFNVYLPADLVKQIKHAAIDEGRSLSTYVEEILRDHLREPSRDLEREK